MPRLTTANESRARETISLYPHPRSALVPLLHLCQEQDGHLTEEAMQHVAELLDLTPAEVIGTASFYDMLFLEPIGTYLVSVCTNIACLLNGGYELLDHAAGQLGVKPGHTTKDGTFTLEEVECIALCDKAPCLTVNWRFFGPVSHDGFDRLVDDLRAGKLASEVPQHGVLCRARREGGLRVSPEEIEKERRAMDAAIADRKAKADAAKAAEDKAKADAEAAAKAEADTKAVEAASTTSPSGTPVSDATPSPEPAVAAEAHQATAEAEQPAQAEETGPHDHRAEQGDQAAEQVTAATSEPTEPEPDKGKAKRRRKKA